MTDNQSEETANKPARNIVNTPQELLDALVKAKPGGQVREQQVTAVDAISNALSNTENLLIEAPTGSGKALQVDTPILTKNGFKRMGDITADDSVLSTQGEYIKVSEAHEPYLTSNVFTIKFENGEKMIADGEHLWPLYSLVTPKSEINESLARLKQDLTEAELPDQMNVSELLSMMNYIPEEILEDFIEEHELEPDDVRSTNTILNHLYMFIRNSNDYNIVTTSQLFDMLKKNPKANLKLKSLSSPIPGGNVEPKSLKSLQRTLTDEKYNSPVDILELTSEKRLELLKLLLKEVGEVSVTGTGYNYLTIPNEDARLDVQFLLSTLGYKSVIITPSGRILFQSAHNLLDLEEWMPPYSTFENNNFIEIESIEPYQAQTEVRCITVESEDHLFLAGHLLVPTHNTLSYLVPTVFHETKAVISTATKQLSEQIIDQDIPFVQKVLKEASPAHQFSAALLKGRDNYYCLAKESEQSRLESDFASQMDIFGEEEPEPEYKPTGGKGKMIAKQMQALRDWAKTTETGDRSEAPAVDDDVWRMFSSTTAECPGRAVCSFASECYSEKARAKAKESDVIVTNHAVVANDLRAEEPVLLGERDTYIFDELHELNHYLTDAWGVMLTAKMLKDSVTRFKIVDGIKDETIDEYEKLGKKFNALTTKLEVGLIQDSPAVFNSYMSQLYKTTNLIAEKANTQSQDNGISEGKRKIGVQAFKQANEISQAALMLMNDNAQEIVRWSTETEDKRTGEVIRTLRATFLRIGPRLQEALSERDANMIGTSATIRVGGSFEIPVHNLALKESAFEHKTQALSSPFTYRKQAMIYVPDENKFPAPNFETRDKHSEKVREEALRLIEAMGGRALMLHTTTFEMKKMGDFLKKELKKTGITVLVQGDAPNPQLIEDFKKDETSVLVATMGMWHGLDVPGPALTLVMMDKIPFTPMNDPLSTARQKWADNNGRSGFMDVYVAEANIMLAQGAGRLVRSVTDKGIIAIFDTRLRTKRYASNMTKSLPDTGYYKDIEQMVAAAGRLRKTLE